MLRKLTQDRYLTIAFIIGLAALVISFIRLDVLWILTSIVYLVLMLGLSTIRQENKFTEDLIKFIVIPLLLGASGVTIFLDSQILFLAVIPIIAFIIILNLLWHTSFQADFDFEGNLIISFTISTGALLGIGAFCSDRYLNTSFLMDNDYLMIDLFFFTVFGIVGGILFKRYLMRKEYSEIEIFKMRMEENSKQDKEQFLEILGRDYEQDERDLKLFISKIIQVGIVIIGVYGFYESDVRTILLAATSFGFTMIPYVYTYNMDDKMPSFFTLMISISLFIYLLGAAIGFYSYLALPFFWWNRLIHFIGGVVLSFLIYVYLYYKNQSMDDLFIPLWLIPLIVVTFLITISVGFELFEFFIDLLFRTDLQNNLTDTVYDLISNIMGSLLSILITHGYHRSYLMKGTFDIERRREGSGKGIFLNRSK